MTKPSLMLAPRDDGPVLATECADLLCFFGLIPDQVRQVRMERELPDLDLSEYSDAFVCGSPWDANVDDHLKEARQIRIEAWLRPSYGRALGESSPILGLCYGLGILTLHLGGITDTHHGGEISDTVLTKTDAGHENPLLEGTSDRLHSYVDHHEAVRELTPGMQVLLAGDDTPIQMVRVGEAAWATQFHPEMDLEGVNVRIDQYANRYYPADKAEAVRAQVAAVDTNPSRLALQNSVRRFQRQHSPGGRSRVSRSRFQRIGGISPRRRARRLVGEIMMEKQVATDPGPIRTSWWHIMMSDLRRS